MGISYNFIRFLLSEKIDIQPAFFTIFRESNTTSDRFVIALHVQVMADIGIILFFVGIALTACYKSLFIFPHHLEVSFSNFCCSFAPRSIEVRTRILRTFAAITKMTVSFIRSEVVGSLIVSAGLLFFWCECQRIEILGCTIFVDFRKAIFAPSFTEKGLFRRRRG